MSKEDVVRSWAEEAGGFSITEDFEQWDLIVESAPIAVRVKAGYVDIDTQWEEIELFAETELEHDGDSLRWSGGVTEGELDLSILDS